MTTLTDAAPLKEVQKFIWSQGDFSKLAVQVMPAAEGLVAAAGTHSGDRVLDVAAGTGNCAVAAARLGATVTATDITPRMVEEGRARSEAEGLRIDWLEADAEALPFEDGSFDRVVTSYGAMFAPRPEIAAQELFRICREGGTVAMANWTPDSFPGRGLSTQMSFMPPPPEGVPNPMEWGIEDVVRERLGGLTTDLRIERRSVAMEHPSVEDMHSFHTANLGPLVAAKMALGDRFPELAAKMRTILEDMNEATDGSLRIMSDYLVVVAKA